MGNEALRASRSSTSFRRSSRSRRSQKASSSGGQQYIAEDEVDPAATAAAAASDLTPKPARRMDRIRRSLSFRRKKKSSSEYNIQSGSQTVGKAGGTSALAIKKSNSETQAVAGTTANGPSTATSSTINNTATPSNGEAAPVTRPHLWIEDEKKVRAGNCSFQVKYLGFQEVSDSRGMHICEQALEKLIAADRKKPVKAILYVSGDSLRVVDESNKTLLVDQTIEKVSFCAPDRHHDAGFAYICRDGTSRRWLCHGFLAAKDTLKQATPGATGGERLSHAVGCAFSVCLEKKQKRERENVSMEHGPMHSFARLGSFRQASLTERFDDPQAVMPKIDPVPIRTVENPHAIERPKPSNEAAFRRGEAGRGTMLMQPGGGAAFNRRNQAAYASLKPGELPSFQQQREKSGFNGVAGNSSANTPSSLAETKTALLAATKQQQQQQQYQNMTLAQLANGIDHTPNSVSKSDTFNKLNTISAIPEENLLESSPPPAVAPAVQSSSSSSSIPTLASPLQPLQPTPVLQPTPTPPPRPPSSSAAQPQSNPDPLSNQLMITHLNVDPPPEWSQPAVSATIDQTAVTNAFAAQTALTNTTAPMNQYFATNAAVATPTIFATPQSIATGTPLLATQSVLPNTTPIYQPIYTTNPYLTSPSSSSLGTASAAPNVLIPSLMATPGSTAVSAPQETFEQKWARYQAAKKQTNPFAEDIAKKYEIKL